jgi:hypothetical protein
MSNILTLNFKKKHIGYCASIMMNGSISQYFDLVSNVKSKLLSGTYDLEDLVTIEIKDIDLVTLYTNLGYLSERTAALVNKELKETLLPQLLDISNGETDQKDTALSILSQLTEIDSSASTLRNDLIQRGIDWLTT